MTDVVSIEPLRCTWRHDKGPHIELGRRRIVYLFPDIKPYVDYVELAIHLFSRGPLPGETTVRVHVYHLPWMYKLRDWPDFFVDLIDGEVTSDIPCPRVEYEELLIATPEGSEDEIWVEVHYAWMLY